MATDTETNELALPILDPGDSEERVRKMLAHLFPEVAAQHATAVSEAETRLAAESVVGKARQAGFRVKNLALLRDKELAKTGKDQSLSDTGKSQRQVDVRAALSRSLDMIEGELFDDLDRLEAKHPKGFLFVPKSAWSAEATALLAGVLHWLPGEVLEDSVGWLARAVAESTPAEEKHRANTVLNMVFAPLARRRAEVPERFVSGLQGVNGEFSELVRIHLDTTNKGPMARAVTDYATEARSQWRFLRNSTEQASTWPEAEVLLDAVPLLIEEGEGA